MNVLQSAALILLPNIVSVCHHGIRGTSRDRMPYGLVTTPGWVFAVVWPILYMLLGVAINICKSDTLVESSTLVGNHFECMVGIVR
jgi:tryptophan-rich sensory protein